VISLEALVTVSRPAKLSENWAASPRPVIQNRTPNKHHVMAVCRSDESDLVKRFIPGRSGISLA
jgi:hypothetical protein